MNAGAVQLRPAGAGDLGGVLELWAAAEAHPTSTDDRDALERLLAHDAGALILAEADGRLVASVIASWDGWRGSIYRLAVLPGYRRRGLAGQLVATAEARLRLLGARRLQAIAVESDAHALAFWRASGWEEQAGRVRFVRG
jgi:ribosomal protein S18 acetylase RimI-like enzyme